MDIESRPAKKRRFFVDDPADEPPQLAAIGSYNASSSRPTSATSTSSLPQPSSSQTDLTGQRNDQYEPTFDANTFRTFIGEEVSLEVLDKIKDASNGNLERAVNMYFDGSWKNNLTSQANRPLPSRGVETWLQSQHVQIRYSSVHRSEGDREQATNRQGAEVNAPRPLCWSLWGCCMDYEKWHWSSQAWRGHTN